MNEKQEVWEAIKRRDMEDPNASPLAKLIAIKEDVMIYNALFGENKDWSEILNL